MSSTTKIILVLVVVVLVVLPILYFVAGSLFFKNIKNKQPETIQRHNPGASTGLPYTPPVFEY